VVNSDRLSLEDADHDERSMSMLHEIAGDLDQKAEIKFSEFIQSIT